jgi:hypothetical protein
MDAKRAVQVVAATEMPESNRLLHFYRVVLKPISGFVGCLRGTRSSSGGWVRASGLLLFRETLLPSELHRNVRDAGRS